MIRFKKTHEYNRVIEQHIGIYGTFTANIAGDLNDMLLAFFNCEQFSISNNFRSWLVAIGYVPVPLTHRIAMIIPALVLGSQQSGSTMRMTRTMMLETLRQDYIRTAWSKGLSERIVVIRHAMKNALIPVVTMVGGGIPSLVGGAVIIEFIFNLPGMGRLMVDALNGRDYPIISAINLIMATVVIANNLFIDLTYGWLDPRIHYQ